MLKNEVKLLEGQGVSLEISRPAREWLLAQNDHPEWGARPLRRIIQKFLREPLADWMLDRHAAQRCQGAGGCWGRRAGLQHRDEGWRGDSRPGCAGRDSRRYLKDERSGRHAG